MESSDAADSNQYSYRFGSAEFNEARFELRVAGLVIDVQHKPLQLLALLLAAAGEVVSKEVISARIWADRPTVENVIANAVSKLRNALGADNGGVIVTVPKLGYRFVGSLERVVTGRGLSTRMALQAGMPVAGREHWLLSTLLGSSQRSETWLACHGKTGDARVYKFAADGARLPGLKREATAYRFLRARLGDRDDFARVLDWNFEQAPFYLECEYGGVALERWAAQALDASTRLAQMSTGQRLRLMLQAIEAVAAAHEVGVLHGDLKPGNMLVDARGAELQLRLTDFGSARLLDPDELESLRITRMGMTLAPGGSDADSGTPFYLAPELVLGEAPTVRSDVYSLGVVLYQVLAGDLRKQMAPGWERDITDELLREDIARATDVDPAQRLPSSTELARRLRLLDTRREALHRRRDDEERAARAQQAMARAKARRPWVMAALLALLLGGAASLWLYAAERRAAAALARQFELADSLNRLLREDIIAAANPAASGRADVTVAQALTAAAAAIEQKFSARAPAVRAGLHQAMQSAFSELSNVQDAVAAGRRALVAYARVAAPDMQQVQDVRLRLALDLAQMSRFDELAQLVGQIDKDAGPPAQQAPEFLARLLYVKAWQSGDRQSLKAGTDLLREAWKLVEPLPPAQAPWRDKIEFALADALRLQGQADESERLFRRLLDEQTRLLGADHARTSYTKVGLANALRLQHRPAEATALLAAAAKGLAARLGPGHRATLSAIDMLAETHFDARDYGRAFDEWRDVHRGYSALMGANSSYTLTVQTNMGLARLRGGQAAQAEALLRDALTRIRGIEKDDAAQSQYLRYSLADCLLQLRQPAEVPALLRELRAEALSEAEQSPYWAGRIAYQQGRLALQSGARTEARTRLGRALELLASAPSTDWVHAGTVRGLLDTMPQATRASR